MTSLTLASHDYVLSLMPSIGGSIARFAWRGEEIFRTARAGEILESSCFALVPFSNRIAGSRFTFADESVELEPNHPQGTDDPVLHGFGWLAAWTIEAAQPDRAILRYDHKAGSWPWSFTAVAGFELSEEGLCASLALHNRSTTPMPAGLGFHPYFPRATTTRYLGLHSGEWLNDAANLPIGFDQRDGPIDWWTGEPVGSRIVDTAYSGRAGALRIEWPERGLGALIEPSDDLAHTVVYVPAGEDYFCVEPVSHPTDALNRDQQSMRILQPDERWRVSMRVRAHSLP